ncbi:MAG: FtsW/RodA/SpoVE family cell cycle protein, partial [Elusimicrobiales bacterium]|nr:FtsW/RodA/SpoVE family cell cycle protein [Elusimicrobiales bacterium]
MLLFVVFFTLFGFSELFSVYLPQFYDKIELPVLTIKEFFIVFFAFAVIVAIVSFGKKINEDIYRTNWAKKALPWIKFCCFITLNIIVFSIAQAYPGTMKGYKILLGQLSCLAIGFAFFIYVSDMPLRRLQYLSGWTVGFLCFVVLCIQFLPRLDTPGIGGVHRAFKGIQVCDLLAPMIVFSLAWMGVQDKINRCFFWIPIILFTLVIWLMQSNLSTALVYASIASIIAWSGGIIIKIPLFKYTFFERIKNICDKRKNTLFLSILGAMLLVIALLLIVQISGVKPIEASGSYWKVRFANWVNYDADVMLMPQIDKDGVHFSDDYIKYINGKGAQGFYSKLTIMHGGITPKLAGSSVVNNKRKLDVSWTDFIFAVMCSEYGLIGMLLIILLAVCFMLYFSKLLTSDSFRNERMKQGNEDDYLIRVADGVFIYLSVFIIAHVYVNLSMFPNTGLPLPLFSLGGASLIINMVMLGVLFNLAK